MVVPVTRLEVHWKTFRPIAGRPVFISFLYFHLARHCLRCLLFRNFQDLDEIIFPYLFRKCLTATKTATHTVQSNAARCGQAAKEVIFENREKSPAKSLLVLISGNLLQLSSWSVTILDCAYCTSISACSFTHPDPPALGTKLQ